MTTGAAILATFPLPVSTAWVQSVNAVHSLPRFMGREITVTEPERDADSFFPKGPAPVCIEGPPQRQRCTAPEAFGNSAQVTAVRP